MNRKFFTGGISQFGFGTFNSGVRYVPLSKMGNDHNVSPLSGSSPNPLNGKNNPNNPSNPMNGSPGSGGNFPNNPNISLRGPNSSGNPNAGLNFPNSNGHPSGNLGLPGKNGNNPNVGLNFPNNRNSPSGNLGFPNRANQPGPGVLGNRGNGNGGLSPNLNLNPFNNANPNNGYPYNNGNPNNNGNNPFGLAGSGPLARKGLGNYPNDPNNPFGLAGSGPLARKGLGNYPNDPNNPNNFNNPYNPNNPYNNPINSSGYPNRYDPFNPNRQNGSMTPNPLRSKSYLTPEILKMQQLENKLSKLGDPYNPYNNDFNRGGRPGDLITDPYNRNNPYMNNTAYRKGNPGMGRMITEDPYNGLPPFLADRENRRNQIKAELKRARDIVNNDSEESATESEEDSDKYSKTKSKAPKGSVRGSVRGSVIDDPTAKSEKRKSILNPTLLTPNMANRLSNAGAEILSSQPNGSQNGLLNNPEINKSLLKPEEAKSEAQEFINTLPKHIALRLQGDNFKARENMSGLKSNFKDIENELEGQLEEMEMKQKMNFEAIKDALEKAGRLDVKDPKDQMNDLQKLIDEKINQREKLRGIVKENQINEETKIFYEPNIPTESSKVVEEETNNQIQYEIPNYEEYSPNNCGCGNCGNCGNCCGMQSCHSCCNCGGCNQIQICPNCGGIQNSENYDDEDEEEE